MLHEVTSASVSVTMPLPQGLPPKFEIVAVVPGSCSVAGPGSSVSGVYAPLDSAAAVSTTLNVEPGGSVLTSGRLSNGCAGSAFSAS